MNNIFSLTIYLKKIIIRNSWVRVKGVLLLCTMEFVIPEQNNVFTYSMSTMGYFSYEVTMR